MPEPQLRPSPIWLARAVTLPRFFADSDGVPIAHDLDGPATFGTDGASLHPALGKACAQAAARGFVVVGYVAVSA